LNIEVPREVADFCEGLHQMDGAPWAGDDQGISSSLKGHGLKKPWNAQYVVGVQMGQKYMVEAHHARPGSHHLPLRPFSAVE
jgi:hypothetical protein